MRSSHETAAERLIQEVVARVARRDEVRTILRALGALGVLLVVILAALLVTVGGSVAFAMVLERLGR
ncbi:MAG TPA: hypothetical protein VFQ38_00155 [Longimicrobiales bacterium]|nr:hypothetical protein [Longimicrobiales bacterium]